MGLTIHYDLRFGAAKTLVVSRLIKRLHAAARDLPFDQVEPIVEFQLSPNVSPPQFPCGLFHADGHAPVGRSGIERPLKSLAAFRVLPGPGCESAEFGLARFTRQRSWSWHAFCKTQYASDTRAGGVENFLRCHLSVVRLLDRAGQLGFDVSVADEGGYWKHRDRNKLVLELVEYNQLIAGLGGQFKDAVGDNVTSPIFGFPNFEHLEARGRTARKRK